MTTEVIYKGPDGTMTAYEETAEERAARIASRAELVRKALRLTKGQAEVIERAQSSE